MENSMENMDTDAWVLRVELNTNLHRLQSCKLLTVIKVNFIILTWEN